MTRHTVIPDIHADFERLQQSLQHASANGQVAFLGDFIDAGKAVEKPADFQVLELARTLISDGKAVGVMGNHELNAILYHAKGENGAPMRQHSPKNQKQHQSFIDEFGVGTARAVEWTDWFLEALPLWAELDGLRLVHACWSDAKIDEVRRRRPDGYLKREDLQEIADESTAFGQAVKALVTGPEVELPPGYSFHDFHGNERKEVRLAWWNADAVTWPEATLSVPDPLELPQDAMPAVAKSEIYQSDAPPVLVGHYKMKGVPRIEHKKASSIDYPGAACVYHWSGGNRLNATDLVTL